MGQQGVEGPWGGSQAGTGYVAGGEKLTSFSGCHQRPSASSWVQTGGSRETLGPCLRQG